MIGVIEARRSIAKLFLLASKADFMNNFMSKKGMRSVELIVA